MKREMKKGLSICLAIIMILGLFPLQVMKAEAADYIITEATFFAQRLDVVCVRMAPLETVYASHNKNFNLVAVDENSGYYVNGVKVATSAEHTQWGLHPTGTTIKGAEYAPGDYFEIMGTFTETVTNKTYNIDLHMHCISGGGTGVSSTAQWEFLPKNMVPAFVDILGFSRVDYDDMGAYAILDLSEEIGGEVGAQTVACVLKDGIEAEITLEKVAANAIMVRTSDDTEHMKVASTYTIKAGTKVTFEKTSVLFKSDYTFYVSADGFSESLPIKVAYKKTIISEDVHEIVMHSRPAVNVIGTIGKVDIVIISPSKPVEVFEVDMKAGEISGELILSIPKEYLERVNELLEVGTELSIVTPAEVNETMHITEGIVVYWTGTEWTDVKEIEYVRGDATNNGRIDLKDIIRYKRYISDKEGYVSNDKTDLSKDGNVDEFDVVLVRRMVLGEEMGTMPFGCDLTITSPTPGEIVYPYVDKVYQFLTTDNADIWDYYVAGNQPGRDGSLKDIVISWENLSNKQEIKYATKNVVEYATKEDFSDSIRVVTDNNVQSLAINNLYKASDYYVRVTAYAGEILLGTSSVIHFKTTDIGPRVMTVDGIYNVRDLGGYMTESGKRTVQGLLYRGGEMDGNHHIALTEKGNETMSNLMGIKYDMDFRTLAECNFATESPIASAIKTHHIIGGYADVFGGGYKEEIRDIFATFANKDNYPIYYHCWGGADRTGTISFLVNGLCGVSEKELIQDYEFTSYSIFGVRADHWDGYNFDGFLAQLKTYAGDTLSEKIETYLLTIGVTVDEIYNIKAIMFGEEPIVTVSCAPEFDRNTADVFKLKVTNGGRVASIYIEGEEVAFTKTETGIEIMAADMPSSLVDGQSVSGRLVLADGTEKELGFVYKYESIPNLSEYWKTETGILEITTEGTISDGQTIGYGQKISMDIQTGNTSANGGLRVAIGSYGFELRGAEFRAMSLSSSGSWAEVARNTGMSAPVNFFDGEDSKLIMSISMVNNSPVMYLKAINAASTKEYTYTFPSRISDEIVSESAKVSFYIRTAEISKLIIQTGTAEKIDNLSNYWSTATGEVVLDSATTTATSDLAVGYNKKVQIDMQTFRDGGNGSLFIMLGSYGVRMRAGTFRMSVMTAGGSPAEVSPRVEKPIDIHSFDTEGSYIILETEVLSDTEMKLSWKAVRGDGTIMAEESHTFTRVANEISSEDAKVTVANTTTDFNKIIIRVGKS